MPATATNDILELGARWVRAELAADVETLGTLATDDFHLVGPFGFVLDKQQWLDRYGSGDLRTTALDWRDVDARQYADTVVTIATQSQQAAYRGNPTNGDFRITTVFVRDHGRWVMASIQLSPTTPPPTPGAPGAGSRP
jgi:hypothetical protein